MAADEELLAVLDRAGVPAARIAAAAPLTGGTYNALHGVDLTDGARLVLKVPPPAHRPRLRYEAELLHGEALFYASAASAGVPAPRVVRAEPDERADRPPYLLMTRLPGVPWRSVTGDMARAERDRLRAQLGGLMAGLHAVRGPAFGYPAQAVAPPPAAGRPPSRRWPARCSTTPRRTARGCRCRCRSCARPSRPPVPRWRR